MWEDKTNGLSSTRQEAQYYYILIRGRFREGGGRILLRDSTPCRPQKSPLSIILKYPFLVTDPKNFLKQAPWAPKYISFEGGARAEKAQFFGQHFQKVPKNAFFGLFFFLQILPVAQKFWPKQGLFKIRHPPARENPRSAPVNKRDNDSPFLKTSPKLGSLYLFAQGGAGVRLSTG